MTDLEIMRAARALITPPGSWTQGDYAKDASGNSVDPGDASATCFCSSGSIRHVSGNIASRLTALICHISGKYDLPIPMWNDHPGRTHAEVLAEFDEVIAKLEGVQ